MGLHLNAVLVSDMLPARTLSSSSSSVQNLVVPTPVTDVDFFFFFLNPIFYPACVPTDTGAVT